MNDHGYKLLLSTLAGVFFVACDNSKNFSSVNPTPEAKTEVANADVVKDVAPLKGQPKQDSIKIVTRVFDTVGTHSLQIPSDATNITYEVIGGTGGQGGSSFSIHPSVPTKQPKQGEFGSKIMGTFIATAVSGKTIKVYVAGNGENGKQSAIGGAPGGKGGSGFYSGGQGGQASDAAPTWSHSAGGGGGGGASAISIDGIPIVIAGGGGGSGGAGYNEGIPVVLDSPAAEPIINSKNIPAKSGNGATGESHPQSAANSGGGGGGGGAPSGSGGTALGSGNHHTGGYGNRGGSYKNPTFVNSATFAVANTPGKISITYSTISSPQSNESNEEE